jgi:hypothetical protein
MGYNTYGIIREVTKTHAVQENRGRAKTVPCTRSSPALSLQIKEMSVLHQTPINNFAASVKYFVSMFFNPLSI